MCPSASCVMLDMGQVLLSVDSGRFARRMRALTGLEEDHLRGVFLRDDLLQQYETGRMDAEVFHEEIQRRSGAGIDRKEFEAAWNSAIGRTPIVPEKLLSSLSGRANLWMLSNTNKVHFDYISARFSFLRFFSGFVLSHEVGALKPDESIFQLALRKAGARAVETLFVDDQPANVDAARRLGMDAIRFQGADHLEYELRFRNLV